MDSKQKKTEEMIRTKKNKQAVEESKSMGRPCEANQRKNHPDQQDRHGLTHKTKQQRIFAIIDRRLNI